MKLRMKMQDDRDEQGRTKETDRHTGKQTKKTPTPSAFI